jgi:hypothetical protein
MITLQYPETLAPARAQERIVMRTLAGVGRLLKFSTAP